MTISQLIQQIGQYQHYILYYFGAIILLSFFASLLYKPRPGKGVLDYFLSFLVYLVAVPGMFSLTLLLYSSLMLRTNLLNVNLVVYFVPLVAMFLVFFLIARKTSLTALPGFGKIASLLTMLGIVFLIIFFLSRLHFVVGFFGSIKHLLLIALVLFIVFRVAAWRFFGGRKQ